MLCFPHPVSQYSFESISILVTLVCNLAPRSQLQLFQYPYFANTDSITNVVKNSAHFIFLYVHMIWLPFYC